MSALCVLYLSTLQVMLRRLEDMKHLNGKVGVSVLRA